MQVECIHFAHYDVFSRVLWRSFHAVDFTGTVVDLRHVKGANRDSAVLVGGRRGLGTGATPVSILVEWGVRDGDLVKGDVRLFTSTYISFQGWKLSGNIEIRRDSRSLEIHKEIY